jgi:flavin-dependent dehydrogenase
MPDTECWTTVQSRIRSEGKKVDRMLAFLNRDIDHYGWVVPKDGHVLIGLGVNRKNDYREAFRVFRTMLEKQHGIFGPDVGRLRSRHVTRLRSWREIYPGRGRILLAGEAAGLICPWSGEGISSAVFSGGLAGSLLAQHSPLRKYKRHLMLQIPRRIFNQIGYQTMTRPWACRLMALAIPGNDFRPLGELRQR